MKKIFILLLIFICPFLFLGCQNKNELKDNFSEITKIYYQGVDVQYPNIKSSISVGQRENPYIIDGFHTENCDFSLFVVDFNRVFNEEELNVKIFINDEEKSLVLYYNPLNGYYMADLGYAIGDNDSVKLIYEDYNIVYKNVSNDFVVDYSEAIDIATKTLSTQIEDIINSTNFPGECYLKILTRQDGNFDKLFWFFNIVTLDGNNYNVVISVDDGNVVLTN